MKKYLIIGGLLIMLSSCSFIFKSIFGFKTIKEIKSKDYQEFINECKEDNFNIVFIMSDSTFSSKFGNYGLSDRYKSLLMQPMQSFLFKKKELIFFVANCLVPPKLPNLNWNYQDKFDVFPPKNTIDIDSLGITLNSFSDILPNSIKSENFKYNYIVNWNLMTKRQSQLLINEIKENIRQFNIIDSTMLIINNTDDFYIKSEVEF